MRSPFSIVKFILPLIILICVISNINAVSIDQNSYFGCFPNNRLSREFTAYPGFIDRTKLIPSQCVQACSTLGYSYAAIESGAYCFCRMSSVISAIKAADSNCQVLACPGDSSTYCGSDSHLVVYLAGGIVASLAVTPTTPLVNTTPFSRFSFDVTFSGPAKYVYLTTSDGAVSSYDANITQPIRVTQTLIDTGITSLEFSASASTANSINAKKLALSSGIVQDNIGNLAISCPAYSATNDYVLCDVTVTGGGSHMEIVVSYGDGLPDDTFRPQDSELLYFGTPVPNNVAPLLLKSVPAIAQKYYIITNSEFKFDGILRAIEIYAAVGGIVNIHVLSPCGGTFCCKQTFPTNCNAGSDVANTFNCATGPFSTLKSACLNQTANLANRYRALNNTPVSWSVRQTIPATLVSGYNIINSSSIPAGTFANTGWLLGIEIPSGSNAKIGVDDSTSTYEDYEVTGYTPPVGVTVAGTVAPIAPNNKLMVRAMVIRDNVISTFRSYPRQGTYLIQATLRNTLIAGTPKTVQQNVNIRLGITNLTIIAPPMCEINVPCTLTAAQSEGLDITYTWDLNGTTRVTNDSTITHTFTSYGTRLLTLVAVNPVSMRVFRQNITISQKITGVELCVNSCGTSASIVGTTANFLFKLSTGRDYTCTIDFGDSGQRSFSFPTTLSNSLISYNYTSEAVRRVTITCSNFLSTNTFNVDHHVQFVITGLRLIQKGAVKNTPYNVRWQLDTGTAASFVFTFAGVVDANTQYSESTKIGQSSQRTGEAASAVYLVTVVASNRVSQSFLNDTFEVSAMISNPSLQVLLDGTTQTFYLFPSVLNFVVNMDMGSNVRVALNIGEENETPIVRQVSGDWTQPLYINTSYLYPGDYNVTLNVSNSLGFNILVQRITVMSSVDKLLAELGQDPVLYMFTQSSGAANFRFKYEGTSCAGSHANVTIETGDSGKVIGPFNLGMNFAQNISKTPMIYSYSTTGNYTCRITAANPLGSKTFVMIIQVVSGLDGVYTRIDPENVAPDNLLTFETYIVQGTGVTLEWFVDGTSLGANPRISNTYKVPDRVYYPTVGKGLKAFNVTLKAYDKYITVFKYHTVEIQRRVSFNVVTNPLAAATIDDDGTTTRRTVTFRITVLDGTNPYYIIDYGDGSLVDFPVNATINSTIDLTHTFPDSGYYNVNITVANLISSLSQVVKVGLLSQFTNFACQLKYRLFENDDALEYDQIYDSWLSVYKVREDFPLRLNCSYDSLTTPVETINVTWNGVTISQSASSLKRSINSTHVSYIAVVPVSLLKSGRMNDPVTVVASNPLYSGVFTGYILKVPSLKDIKFEKNTTVSIRDMTRTFKVLFGSLGEPSCARVWYKVGRNVSRTVSYGTPEYCSAQYPTTLYFGTYNTAGGVLSFDMDIQFDGLVEVTFAIKNDVDAITATTNVTISATACMRPLLDIEERASDFFNPKVIPRSVPITVKGLTTIQCDQALSNDKQWFLYSINPSNGSILRSLNVSNYSGSKSAWLFIDSTKTPLSYGTYKFVYQVNMTGAGTAFVDTIETYIRIVPTGIGIYAFAGGLRQVTRGTAQQIEIDPGKYSVDLDKIYDGRQLKYRYFCRIAEDGLPSVFPAISLNNYVNLRQIKENNSLVTINATTTCFDSTDSYFFNQSDTILTIKPNAFTYVRGRSFQFLIVGESPHGIYEQLIQIHIENYNTLPVVNLGCKFQTKCSPYRDYQKVNPDTQLMVISECVEGCTDVEVYYEFQVSKEWNIYSDDPQEKWLACTRNPVVAAQRPELCFLNTSNSIGLNKSELTILKSLFDSEPTVKKWKIDFTVLTVSFFGGTAIGKSSLIIAKNEVPVNGTCTVDPPSGLAGTTKFTINCTDWVDPDGFIAKYEYFYSQSTSPLNSLISFDINGQSVTPLPLGTLNLYVRITDNTGGTTRFNISTLVTVTENNTLVEAQMREVLSGSTTSIINQVGAGGDPLKMSSIFTSFFSSLNNKAAKETDYLIGSGANPSGIVQVYGSESNMSFTSNFDNIADIKTQNTYTITNVNLSAQVFDPERNKRAEVRTKLVDKLQQIDMNDPGAATLVANLGAVATYVPTEVTREATNCLKNLMVTAMNKIVDNLEYYTAEQIKEVGTSALFAMSAITIGASVTGNGLSSTLDADLRALNTWLEYDTDLELYDTNPNFVDPFGVLTSAEFQTKKNQIFQKRQVVDLSTKNDHCVSQVSKALSAHQNIDQEYKIKTPSLVMTISKTEDKDNNGTKFEGLSKITTPKFCSMDTGCSNIKNLTVVSTSMPVATTGFNGDNETNVGSSNQVSLGYFTSEGAEIQIKNLKEKIDIYIPRAPNTPAPTGSFINVSMTNRQGKSLFPLAFNNSQVNASIFLEFAPQNLSAAYIVLVKYGMTPRLNSTFADYDDWKLFCPSDLKNSTNLDKVAYLYYINSTQTKSFTGLVGVGFRELKPDEWQTYCGSTKVTPATPPAPQATDENTVAADNTTSKSLSTNVTFLAYAAACYYMDKTTNKWSTDGVDVVNDTNILFTHCKSSHLTSFAGGWIVVPTAINFNYVFANASIEKNPTIYATVICLVALYILFAVWGRYMDKQDVKKIGVAPLPDNQPGDNYFYEIIVFTGSRKDAGTDSKVRFVLSGEYDETEIRALDDDKRKPFRRGGVDSFIMAHKHSLGNLNYMRIWHDNSGSGKWASWYLKNILINDLQTKQQYHFICQRWLAVEKDDGLIDRILPVAGEAQKTEFSYLLSKESKKNMSDGHLWFSIFARPAQSAFSRLERITCCFVLLFISMLMNIMYYDLDKSTSNGGIEIGPFYLTPEQVGIGIIVNLIVFPPSMLIVELFRRSRRRVRRSAQIKEALQKNIVQTTDINPEVLNAKSKTGVSPNDIENIRNQFASPMPTARPTEVMQQSLKSEKKKKKKPLTLPWWCKIIAYVLSFLFMAVSIFFVIMKGIEFGDQKVSKWLTSLVISFFTSVFLTQPLKVVLVAFFFVMIMKKSNDDEIEDDDEDDDKKDKNLKDDEEWLHHYPSKIFAAKPRSKAFAPLNEGEVEEARENRLKEVKMWDILREILAYSMFLWVLYIVSYANMNSYSYGYQRNLQNTFVSSTLKKDFSSIMKVEDFWDWAREILAPGLRASKWYNNDLPIGLAGYINDKTSRMIGYAMMRQIRVKKDSCTINSQLKNQINFCTADYNFFNEDDGKYGYAWNTFNASERPVYSMDRVYSAFQYRTAGDLNGYPLIGLYNTYWGGGYVYEMRGKMEYLVGNLTLLQQNGWIDRQTRAVIVEFTVYNPNINMFAVAEILLEFLPSGTILTSSRFDPISLLNHYRGFALFALACDIIYVLFIIYFMIQEIRILCKEGRKYLKQFWSLVEWAIIIFSWAAVAMFAYRIYAGNKVLEFFKQTSGYGYYKLQYVAFWNEMLRYMLAFCAALGTLKFLKLLRFNKRMSFLASTISHSAKELIAFAFMFIIIWCAFVQLMYLFFQDKTLGFSTFIRAMTTCFEIMLGKFQVDPLMKAHGFFGPLLFSLYNIFVVFILLNMFISIINDTFTAVRNDVEKQADDYHMVNFIVTKFKLWTGIGTQNNPEQLTYNPVLDANKNAYKDQITYFPEKVDELLYILSELYVEQRGINTMYNSEMQTIEQRGQSASSGNVMHINVKEKDSPTPMETKADSAMDRRKSAHRNRSATNETPQSANVRLPSATGRAPPNRLPPINISKNMNDSNL